MVENRSIAVFLAIVLFSARAWSQTPGLKASGGPGLAVKTPDSVSAPAAAERFREIARELAYSRTLTGPQADQAIILLTAARGLDRTAADIEPLLIRLALRSSERDYSDQMMVWLQNYTSASADRAVILDGVRYLLEHLNAIEQRREMLETLAKRIGNRNPAVDSEIATLLGLLMLEKADKDAAKYYLIQAYANNKYNKVAFSKLAELAPNEIGPAVYLEHLRLVLRENPLNINAAVGFSQYAERLQLYDLAAQSYRYCADLFRYLYPTEPLPPHIYLPWAVSCYNSPQGPQACLQIAESLRNAGQFDILLEAIAGKAAMKAGKPDEARKIFSDARLKAQQLLQPGSVPVPSSQQGAAPPQINAKQVAWFYCFADVNPAEAVLWANQAFSVEPNSPAAGALLAYALGMNNQLAWAKPLLTSFEHNQIADLVQAQIYLADGDKTKAIQTLRTAIVKDPGSLAAERARETLRSLGSEYVSPVDTAALMTYLTQNLGKAAVPQFLAPDKMIEVQFSIRGNDFSYGNELDGVIGITNRSAEPLVITPEGLFQGNFRVSARVTGDVKKDIPDLLSQTVRTEMIVLPGKSLTQTVRLSTGELRGVLMTYPQASLDIQFTLYVDPVATQGGAVSNRLVDVKPVTISIKRPAVDVTAAYVRGRYNTISSGQEGQKIQTAHLFTGLLREQYAMAQHGTLYPYRYAEWLPELLRSSLLSSSGLLLSPGQGDWVVKVNTMADLLALPLDQELATAVAKNLNHPQWPVRLMAVYLLAGNHGENFRPVLDWVARQDPHELVRSMAMSLQATSGSTASAGSPAGELITVRP